MKEQLLASTAPLAVPEPPKQVATRNASGAWSGPGERDVELATAPDQLVPDPVVWREFGISAMTGWRWSRDPALDFPPAVAIRGRNFRSRAALQAFKSRMMHAAVAKRNGAA